MALHLKGLAEWMRRAIRHGRFVSDFGFAARYLWRRAVRRQPVVVVERSFPSLGDLLCVAACLPSVRKKYPRSWIVLVTSAPNAPLAAATGAADAVVLHAGAGCFLLERWGQPVRLAAILPDECHPPRPRARRHLAQEFAAVMELPAPTQSARVTAPPAVRRRVQHRLAAAGLTPGKFLVVHTGPTWRVKEWPAAAWTRLAELVRARLDFAVLQIGTDQTSDRIERRTTRWPDAIDWVNQLSILETAEVLAQAAALIGIDSGPLHIAAGLGVPVVGLFGPTDGDAMLFPAPTNQVVHGKVTCLGCHHAPDGPGHWRDGCRNDIACMQTLPPEEVYEALERSLRAVRGSRAVAPEKILPGNRVVK